MFGACFVGDYLIMFGDVSSALWIYVNLSFGRRISGYCSGAMEIFSYRPPRKFSRMKWWSGHIPIARREIDFFLHVSRVRRGL